MKQFTAKIKVLVTQFESEEELDIDDICRPLEDQGWDIQSAFIVEEN